MSKKKYWRLGHYSKGGRTAFQIQFMNRNGEWLTQSQFVSSEDGWIPESILWEIIGLRNNDYEQTYIYSIGAKRVQIRAEIS